MMYGLMRELRLEEGSTVAGEDAKRKGGDGAKGKRGARGACGSQRIAQDGRWSEGDRVPSAGGRRRTQNR